MTRKDKEGRSYAYHLQRGMLFWVIMLSVGLLMLCFLWLGFEQESNATKRYVPPSVNEEGQIIPGHHVDH